MQAKWFGFIGIPPAVTSPIVLVLVVLLVLDL